MATAVEAAPLPAGAAPEPAADPYARATTIGDVVRTILVFVMCGILAVVFLAAILVVGFIAASVMFP